VIPQGAFSFARVLVAEDNAINLKLAKRMLEKVGCRVDAAANGAEAVRMWQEFAYDVIFMDCQMPEMDGYEATEAIRRLERKHVPAKHTLIIALTANAMKGDRERCLAAGMDDFLAKPIPPDAIAKTLQRWSEVAAPV
jgi:CheY-like chemotaxis protein